MYRSADIFNQNLLTVWETAPYQLRVSKLFHNVPRISKDGAKWMSTYQNGLCSDPCTVGRRGGLLTVPNRNSDMMGWVDSEQFVDYIQENTLSVQMSRSCKCSSRQNGQYTHHTTNKLYT
jgi:hypothetical protein